MNNAHRFLFPELVIMWTVFAFSEHSAKYRSDVLYQTTNQREAREVMAWLNSIGWRVGVQKRGGN